MEITIPVKNERKYFRICLEILRSIPPLNTLRYKELDVLAELLYWNDKYRNLDQKIRWQLMFSYENKLTMQEHTLCDAPQLDNCLTGLRKKGILVKRTLPKDFGITLSNPQIKFDFKINERSSI